ncbi:hypothetical protein BGZ95_004743 [Linnemannia exigua]|uniref:Uncharacterized protein n=1 Tax=Linnemannia exigua TaxID=604196 RepID=A0AAD4H1M8_9FUNG|nr:hypothetical protein BGZ95_004743 [Linnemannia exigua]
MEPAVATNDIQRAHGTQAETPSFTDTRHGANPISNLHTFPVSLRESNRPPNSFKDALSSQRHEKPQTSLPVEHNLEHIRPMNDAHRMESSSQLPFGGGGGGDRQLDSHQDSHIGQPALALESNDLVQQDQGQVSEPPEETETPRPQGRQHEESHHQSLFASFQQPLHGVSSITQEPQRYEKSISDLFNLQAQPSACSTIAPEYRQESVSDLFNPPPQLLNFNTHELLDRPESAEDFFGQAAQQRRVETQEPSIRKESVSCLSNQVPQSQSFDLQELAEHTQQVSEPFTQVPLSIAFSTQEHRNHGGLPSAIMQGVPQPFSFDYSESVPSEPMETSSTQEGSPFETVRFESHDPPMVPSWQPQEPVQDISAEQVLDSQKDLPIVPPATFSFNSQFEDIDNSFTIHKQQPEDVNESVAHQAQPTIPPPDLQDQSIPFDETLPSPTSPGFGRNTMGSFAAHDIHGARTVVQPGSYSILELSSELAHTAYFSQARESPRLQERVSWSKVSSDPGTSDLSQGVSPKLEVETIAFDQVSLAEDAPGTNHSVPASTTSTSLPTKERGLASLLDPSTLSAVEDLLNMPKSAAFERGMTAAVKIHGDTGFYFCHPRPTSGTPRYNQHCRERYCSRAYYVRPEPTPDTTTTATAPSKTPSSSKFDWAHKQSNVFLESVEILAADPKDEADTLSHVIPGLPHKLVDEGKYPGLKRYRR